MCQKSILQNRVHITPYARTDTSIRSDYMNKNEVLINEVIEDGEDSPRSSGTKGPHDIVSWDMLMDVPKDKYRTVGREWDIGRATNDLPISPVGFVCFYDGL